MSTWKENPQFFEPTQKQSNRFCTTGCEIPAEIIIIGYTRDTGDIFLCTDCAQQLVRKLSEDLCVYTRGGRHG